MAYLDSPYALAIDDLNVFVGQSVDKGGVQRIAKVGGPVTVLSDKGGRSFHMSLSATHVYYTTSVNGQVKRLSKFGGLEVLADFQHFPRGVVTSGSDVYWTYASAAVNGGLRHLNLFDGAVEDLLEKLRDPWTLVLHGTSLLFSAHGTDPEIVEYSITDSKVINSYPTELQSNDMAVTDSDIFYTTNTSLFRVNRASGSQSKLLSGVFVDGVAVANGSVYVTERGGAGMNGRVRRLDLGSGLETIVAEGFWAPRRVVVDSECVYFTDQGPVDGPGSVVRAPR